MTRRRPAWLREVGLTGVLYVLYEGTRSALPAHPAQAFANAHTVQAVEGALDLAPEATLNRALESHPVLIGLASVYYQTAHVVVTLAVLVLLWRRGHDAYRPARRLLTAVTLLGLAGYRWAPTAPPRFAMPDVVDTVSAHPVLFAGHDSVQGMANLFAAMPSLHVAWAVWCTVAVGQLMSARWWVLAWAHPTITVLVVLATANHYLLDAVAGTALVAVCVLVQRSMPAAWAALVGRPPGSPVIRTMAVPAQVVPPRPRVRPGPQTPVPATAHRVQEGRAA